MDNLDVHCPFCDGEDLRPRYSGKRLTCADCGANATVAWWARLAERQAEEAVIFDAEGQMVRCPVCRSTNVETRPTAGAFALASGHCLECDQPSHLIGRGAKQPPDEP